MKGGEEAEKASKCEIFLCQYHQLRGICPDLVVLGKELDQLWISLYKLFVNFPRFWRGSIRIEGDNQNKVNIKLQQRKELPRQNFFKKEVRLEWKEKNMQDEEEISKGLVFIGGKLVLIGVV
ncbi:hypothetical protein RIF29_24009 [Crotalaria pallida]|uniref:Uncharacterized protein n=1 Tax=Crotalaria pallida TaxID=3830 RepID=A0AAN9EJI5_CROPI